MAQLFHRRSVRLSPDVYVTAGAFLVTVCTFNRVPALGEVKDGAVLLSPLGKIVDEEWRRNEQVRVEITLGDFVIMPNHVHAVVLIENGTFATGNPEGARRAPLRRDGRSLGSLLAGFKAVVTSRAHKELEWQRPVWQRNYHEHAIRNEADMARILEYIANNPMQWELDRYQ